MKLTLILGEAPGGGEKPGTVSPCAVMHWAYMTSYCCCSDICAKPEPLAPATVPSAAPEAAPIAAPRPPPIAAPSPAPSAVLRMVPPTAWLLAAYAAGAVCDAAYCWQTA